MINPAKRIYLICREPCAETELQPLLSALQEHHVPYVVHDLVDGGVCSDEEWQRLFAGQKMGTQLFLAGRAETVEILKKLAILAGFSKGEIGVIIIGGQSIRLFCAACQQITVISPCEQVDCGSCGRLLTVTSHYSHRLEAYLGYVEIR